MPETLRLAKGGTYDPDWLDMLSHTLEDIWIEVGDAFPEQDRNEVRNTIAQFLFYHSSIGLPNPYALKAIVIEALRHKYPAAPI